MIRIFTLIFCVVFVGTVDSQVNFYEEIIIEANRENNFHGTVIVAKADSILFSKAIGISDRESGLKHNENSYFKIASMTKVFTAVLIMNLVEQNKISLDEYIGTYFPNYNGDGKYSVKIHDLLTYSSGITSYMDTMGNRLFEEKLSLDQCVELYCSGPLKYKPGTKSQYGNEEYILLTKIIELVSGMSYENYLNEIILEPLKMIHTGLCDNDINKGFSKGYIFNDSLKTFEEEPFYFSNNYFGSGAMYSSVHDMYLFDKAIFNRTLLDDTTTDQLLRINPDLGYTAYGFWGSDGWGILSEKFYYRTGAIMGSTANWIKTVENDISIIVLSNTNATNLYQLSEQLYTEATK